MQKPFRRKFVIFPNIRWNLYDNRFLIFNHLLPLDCYYALYNLLRIGRYLYCLQYLTNTAMKRKTDDFNVDGSEPMTSNRIKYVPLYIR